MFAGDGLGRLVSVAAVNATPAVAAAAAEWWQMPTVNLFGSDIPILSMLMSVCGLITARIYQQAREKPQPGGFWLSCIVLIVLAAVVIEYKPAPGMAAGLGIGLGLSAIAVVGMLGDAAKGFFTNVFERLTRMGRAALDNPDKE